MVEVPHFHVGHVRFHGAGRFDARVDLQVFKEQQHDAHDVFVVVHVPGCAGVSTEPGEMIHSRGVRWCAHALNHACVEVGDKLVGGGGRWGCVTGRFVRWFWSVTAFEVALRVLAVPP